jgi:phage gp36-like protein
MYTTATDYDQLIQAEIKNAISADANVWNTAQIQAETEVTSYLRSRYDVAAAMALTGTARNPHLVMLIIDIALYHTHSRISPRNIPELIALRYEQAIDWLKAVNKGDILADLPVLQTATGQQVIPTKFGSNKKLAHDY